MHLLLATKSRSSLRRRVAGWIAGGAYAGTPRAVGTVDVKLGWRSLAVKGGATLTIDCSVNCERADVGQLASRDDCMLSFSFVNDSGLAPDGFAVRDPWFLLFRG